jgi:hypothetical protein
VTRVIFPEIVTELNATAEFGGGHRKRKKGGMKNQKELELLR